MKTFIFIPDTNKKAGLGHFSRCFKYSNFVNKKYEILFLINRNFDKKYLKKKNSGKKKIKFFFFSNLKIALNAIKKKHDSVITFLDTYNSKIREIKFKEFSNKHICVMDFKTKHISDFTIDHTFERKYHYYNSKKVLIGVKNFPIYSKPTLGKRNVILINFGSVKNKYLINKALFFLESLQLKKSLKIIIINKFFFKKDNQAINLKNKIIYYNFVNNIEAIYKNTLFAIGACGISLYEKAFFNIPCVSKSLASNQSYNFKNFISKKCILDFDKMVKLSSQKNYKYESFLTDLVNVENNLKKYFDYKKNKKNLKQLFNKF
jgi:spore coat polysaccharide biosynthesis predicted glycosyltransferase SpsG